MRIPIEQRVKTTRLQMTPMIDVVFLLMTFFMIVAELGRQDQIEGLDLPRVEYAKLLDQGGRLVICVLRDGAYYVGGQPRTLKELGDILIVHARLDPDEPILIRADRRVAFKHIRAIIKRICGEREIRIPNIAFATLPPET